MSNLKIFETGKRFGNMNTNKNFFPKELADNPVKRRELFLENRMKAAEVYGFNPYKFYMPTQQKDGSFQVLTEEMVEAEEDGWDLDIPADILIVTDKTPYAVCGFSVADCPVVMMSDMKNGATATAHCAAEFVDRMLPQMTLDALRKAFDSRMEDISVYVSACAGANWTYDSHPKWATNEKIWEETGALTEENGIYHIDIRKAIMAQLEVEQFRNFLVNPSDTITSSQYYSNSAAFHGVEGKAGRHYAGAFYDADIKTKRKVKSL